jgi:hypothetical protein
MKQERAFCESLFDFSFSSFITPKIIKILYGLGMIVAAVAALGLIFTSFKSSIVGGLLMLLIGGPLMFLIYIIMFRVWLEIIIVLFRIGENVEVIAQGKKETIESQPPTV